MQLAGKTQQLAILRKKMKIYLHKLTALKIITVFLTVIEMPGNVLITKPGSFHYSGGCKKGLSRHLNFRKRNVEFTQDSCTKRQTENSAFSSLRAQFSQMALWANTGHWQLTTCYRDSRYINTKVKRYLNCRELNSFRIDLHYLLEGKVPKLLEYAYCLNVANSAFWQVFLFNNDDFLVSKMGSMTIHSFNKYSNLKENAITIRL